MKYENVLKEADEYGVRVVEGISGTIYWYDSLASQVEHQATAWMSHSTGKQWIAHNTLGTCFRGSKAVVADWCLDQAANGAN